MGRLFDDLGGFCNRISSAGCGGGLLPLSGFFCAPFSPHTGSRIKLFIRYPVLGAVDLCTSQQPQGAVIVSDVRRVCTLARLQPQLRVHIGCSKQKASVSLSRLAGCPPAGPPSCSCITIKKTATPSLTGWPRDSLCITNEPGAGLPSLFDGHASKPSCITNCNRWKQKRASQRLQRALGFPLQQRAALRV